MTRLRAGVIGAGAIAAFRHLPEYAANPEVELVAIGDPRLERAQAAVDFNPPGHCRSRLKPAG